MINCSNVQCSCKLFENAGRLLFGWIIVHGSWTWLPLLCKNKVELQQKMLIIIIYKTNEWFHHSCKVKLNFSHLDWCRSESYHGKEVFEANDVSVTLSRQKQVHMIWKQLQSLKRIHVCLPTGNNKISLIKSFLHAVTELQIQLFKHNPVLKYAVSRSLDNFKLHYFSNSHKLDNRENFNRERMKLLK